MCTYSIVFTVMVGVCLVLPLSLFSVTAKHRRNSRQYYGQLIDEFMGKERCERAGLGDNGQYIVR